LGSPTDSSLLRHLFCISSSSINHRTFICQSCGWHRHSSRRGASWLSVCEWIFRACSILNRHYTVRKTDLVRPFRNICLKKKRNICLKIGLETLQQNSWGNKRFLPPPLPCLHVFCITSLPKHMHLKQESTILSKQHSLSSLIHSIQLLHFIRQKKILLWVDMVVSTLTMTFKVVYNRMRLKFRDHVIRTSEIYAQLCQVTQCMTQASHSFLCFSFSS